MVVQWMDFLKRSLRVRRIEDHPYFGEDTLARLAGLLTLVGPATDPSVLPVFGALVELIFARYRLRHRTFPECLRKVCDLNPEELQQVAAAVRAAKGLENVEQASFSVLNFIEVATQVADPVAYVTICQDRGMKRIRQVFYPPTFESLKVIYRGALGEQQAGAEFKEQVRKLKVVR